MKDRSRKKGPFTTTTQDHSHRPSPPLEPGPVGALLGLSGSTPRGTGGNVEPGRDESDEDELERPTEAEGGGGPCCSEDEEDPRLEDSDEPAMAIPRP